MRIGCSFVILFCSFGCEASSQSDSEDAATDRANDTVIARLVQAGEMGWDDTLAGVFPSYAAGTAFGSVTLDQLVAHRGGFPTQLPSSYWSSVRAAGDIRAQRRRIAELVVDDAPLGNVGTSYRYSNVGFIVAGAMIEQSQNATWDALIVAQVFEPLGMASCGFGPPGTTGSVDQPRGHRVNGGAVIPVPPGPSADNPPALGPAGTVHCSLEDWAKFARAHATRNTGFLDQAHYERMHSALPGEAYRAGWLLGTRSWAAGPTISHNGSNTLNYALLWVAPNTGQAYMATANIGDRGTESELDRIIGVLIDRYAP